MATVTHTALTADDFAALPLEAAVELVRGEMVEMRHAGMPHAIVGRNCLFLLETWNRTTGNHWIVGSEVGIVTEREPDTVRGPDLFVMARSSLPAGTAITGFLEIAPAVCVEILSPHDRWKDLLTKVHEYLQLGVGEIWLIDPRTRRVHLYSPDESPQVFSQADEFKSVILTGFHRPVQELFQDLRTRQTVQ